MVKIKDICLLLNEFAPLSLQESYDNAGLILGCKDAEADSVLITLDVTEEVINEAILKNCHFIIAHHPLIFNGIKQLTGSNYVQRCVIKAVKNDIAIYAAHTNFDNVIDGVSGRMAEKLGLQNVEILQVTDFNNNRVGAGVTGDLPRMMSEQEFLQKLKDVFGISCIKHTKMLSKPIEKVALCGGAGSFLLPNAIAARAQVFVSADFKYHEFFNAENQILIADIGHYESEQFTKEIFYEIITKKFPTFAVQISETNTNPINYF
ncbi:MAG: Nif3-like dinuclear metal center hexameric protein [Paludibacter sp.]|jgi:dinuclear metal center YbgI/SA1388 family protein|nr:Nif3-like dinuclear metal center hexameric protein [Paludibacter sp.]